MNKLRMLYEYLKDKYRLLSLKKYTTLAGTLVFFFVLSILPLSFWLSLLLGKLPINTDELLSLPVFESVKNVFIYVKDEAERASAGASIILIITTLYSSTNLFYQIRRSGEIIYDYHRENAGLRLRLGALILLIMVMGLVISFLLAFALGSFLFSLFFSRAWQMIADYALLSVVAFFLILLLNVYICPYKASMRYFLPGTFITLSLWGMAVVGFSVYLRISNLSQLYGALSAVIVFLLWLYLLMVGFIIGVIWNSEKILIAKRQKRIKIRKSHILPV
jgi:membrane protein